MAANDFWKRLVNQDVPGRPRIRFGAAMGCFGDVAVAGTGVLKVNDAISIMELLPGGTENDEEQQFRDLVSSMQTIPDFSGTHETAWTGRTKTILLNMVKTILAQEILFIAFIAEDARLPENQYQRDGAAVKARIANLITDLGGTLVGSMAT